MEKLVDRISDKISHLLDEPQLLYVPLIRLQQILALWTLVSMIPLLRFESLGIVELAPPLVSLWFSQFALRSMRTLAKNRATALLVAVVGGLIVSPLPSFCLFLYLFSPWFASSIRGSEPSWYLKVLDLLKK